MNITRSEVLMVGTNMFFFLYRTIMFYLGALNE